MARYTLLIPTYNRPALLRSLIGYLGARGFPYPTRVLDSSLPEAVAANRDTIAGSKLNIGHQIYDPATPPHIKFSAGLRSIETPYCSFCADDDILFTDGLSGLLDFLDANPGYAAAHGYYLNVLPGDKFEVGGVVYANPSIDADDALRRIVAQMGNYEAVFYAVYRLPVLQSAIAANEKLKLSALVDELIASSLTLIAGRVHRAPMFYMARNTSPSIENFGWHPHHFLATDVDGLARDYAKYRDTLLECLMADPQCRALYEGDRMQRILDLAHLKYLVPMLSPAVLDYLISASFRGEQQPREVIAGMWHGGLIAGDKRARWRRLLTRAKLALTRLRFNLGLRGVRGSSPRFSVSRLANVDRVTRLGQRRRYVLHAELFARKLADGARVTSNDVNHILAQLDDYV
jgi:glycosyltransferase domain-containing protein